MALLDRILDALTNYKYTASHVTFLAGPKHGVGCDGRMEWIVA